MTDKRSVQPAAQSTAIRRSRRRRHWPIVVTVLALFAGALLIAGSDIFFGPSQTVSPNEEVSKPKTRQTAETTIARRSDPPRKPSIDSALVDDDGRTLWMSPTAGSPLDVSYLPPGAQLVVALRPRALFAHPEGEKIFAALGPTGDNGAHYVQQAIGLSLRDLERLTVAISTDASGNWLTTLVAVSTDAIPLNDLHSQHPNREYHLPDSRGGKLLVVAPQAVMDDIIALGDSLPPLRRDMERLLAHTDADRHVTIVVAPNFLFGEGQGIFSGGMASLRLPVFWFLGDEFSAAALSVHWDDDFFAELIAVPTADTPTERAAEILAQRSAAIPNRVEDHVLGLEPSLYSRRIVARFPAMLRKLTSYTRSSFDRDHATLRAYLPVIAGHNLIMGAELTLAESSGEPASAVRINRAASSAGANPPPTTALQKLTTLRFARETLESALAQLSEDIGVEIIILGPDLQSEGITKNQSLAVDIQNQPAENILVEILRRANPDKSATGPADLRQKLVYVVKPIGPGGPDAIHITTRAAATQRGDTLPQAFTAPK